MFFAGTIIWATLVTDHGNASEVITQHSEYSSGDTYSGQVSAQEENIPFNVKRIAMKADGITGLRLYLYRDMITDVLYMGSEEGGLEAMLDPETGLPLTYTRYMELVAGKQPD